MENVEIYNILVWINSGQYRFDEGPALQMTFFCLSSLTLKVGKFAMGKKTQETVLYIFMCFLLNRRLSTF